MSYIEEESEYMHVFMKAIYLMETDEISVRGEKEITQA